MTRSSCHKLAACIHRSAHTCATARGALPAHPISLAGLPPKPCPSRVQRRFFFGSSRALQQGERESTQPAHPRPEESSSGSGHAPRSKARRPKQPTGRGKNPLRAVADKAQKTPTASVRNDARRKSSADESSRSSSNVVANTTTDDTPPASLVTAVCVAGGFSMDMVTTILAVHGFALDPDGTGFEPHEVVHARGQAQGDIFVFPSGTVVTWALPRDVAETLAARTLLPAAEEPHVTNRETEDLSFVTDPDREVSTVKGDDTVVLGTGREQSDGDRLDTTLAQIAFSSALAQSTKLAVLEASLTDYFESMRRLPENLSRGTDLRLNNRRFILQKTGELLSLRAQLNHYSELTDSLPDLFWESRGSEDLENYFDQVGKALDVRVRIRTLNQKLDYAQEMASVLREMAAQKHDTRLEWIIIILIAVEVMFELRHVYMETTSSTAETKKTGDTFKS